MELLSTLRQNKGFTPYHFYYVYILKSISHPKEFYVGFTHDLRERLNQHNKGKVESTRKYMPWTLKYYEAFSDEKSAIKREHSLKHNGNPMRELKKRIGFSSDSKSDKGFTLIEILITIVILVVIFSFGLFISFDFYKSYAFRSEKNVVVSVLQKARNQSLNNINQARHGVHFQNSPLQYIIFECDPSDLCSSYTPNPSTDIVIDSSYGISVDSSSIPSMPFDVVFNQLSGNCVSVNCLINPLIITVSYGSRSYDISINSEGRIDWE